MQSAVGRAAHETLEGAVWGCGAPSCELVNAAAGRQL